MKKLILSACLLMLLSSTFCQHIVTDKVGVTANSFFDDSPPVKQSSGNRLIKPMNVITGLVDDLTGEQFSWLQVTTWADGSEMTAQKADGFIYRKKGNLYWKRAFTGEANIKWFGAVGDGVKDDREATQKAINTCAELRIPLKITQGLYLFNSYGVTDADVANANILQLASNLHIVFDPGSEFVTGEFFDDKPFVMLSGLNNKDRNNFMALNNISLTGGRFSFNGQSSQMRSSYKRRIAMDAGKITNLIVSENYFYNGDLSNCLAFGEQSEGNSILISNNTFERLAVAPIDINVDHSTIYSNAGFTKIINNTFIGTTTMALIGACAEIHGSNSIFSGNIFSGYTRGLFVAANSDEKGDISNILITSNTGSITNSFVYLWPSASHSISDLTITGNNITHSHIVGFKQLYNGVQGICVALDKGGSVKNVSITGNMSTILENVGSNSFTKTAFLLAGNLSKISIANNRCIGHENGIIIQIIESSKAPVVDDMSIESNLLNGARKLVEAHTHTISNLSITKNEVVLPIKNLNKVIELNSTGLQSGCYITDNKYLSHTPQIEFVPSKAFRVEPTNYARYVISGQTLAIPATMPASNGTATLEVAVEHLRPESNYRILSSSLPPSLIINTTALLNNGAVQLLFKNTSSAPIEAIHVSCVIEVEMRMQ